MRTLETNALPGGNPQDATGRGMLIARIERLPINPMQIRARILVGAATFFDGFDALTIAIALPLLIQKWHLSAGQVGWLIASGSLGQLAGSLLFASLAERHGRVRTIAWSAGVIGLTSIACGLAPTFAIFVVLRIIQGIGLGGEIPVAATYINEITRAHGRGRFVLLYEIIYPIGLLVASALGAWIVPRLGWEAMYFIGGAPLVFFFVLRRLVPESPRWLAEHGRMAQAHEALSAFEKTVKTPLPPITAAHEFDDMMRRIPHRRYIDVFRGAYLRRTLAIALLWATCGVIQFGLSTWLPTIYKNVYHAPLQLALNLAVAASVMACSARWPARCWSTSSGASR